MSLRWDKTRENHICSSVCFALIVLFFADIILFGTGTLTRVGSISSRIILFGVAILISVPMLFQNWKKICTQKYAVCVMVYLVWIGISAVRGYLNNNSFDILKTDVKGYLNYFFLPTMLCVLNTTEKKHALMRYIVIASAIMAIVCVALSYFVFLPNQDKIYMFVNEMGLCGLTNMNGTAMRVFLHSASRFFVVAFMFTLYACIREERKSWKVMYITVMAVFIVTIFQSYTRSIYLGAVIAVGITLLAMLWNRDNRLKKAIISIGMSGLIAVVMVGIIGFSQGTNLFSCAFNRVSLAVQNPTSTESTAPKVDDTTEATETTAPNTNETTDATAPLDDTTSDPNPAQDSEIDNLSIRSEKIEALVVSIKSNPVFGNGLGAAVDIDDGYVEYTYHDVLNKMGIVGLLLWLSPLILEIVDVFCMRFRKKETMTNEDVMIKFVALGIAIYFFVISYFNPCMNTTLGIACYLLTMVLFSTENMLKSNGRGRFFGVSA